MRLKKFAIGAAAALGLAGLAGVAVAAAIQNSHVITVQLPDGSTAHIRYFGDTPPEVRLETGQPYAPAAWPGSMTGFLDPGFPALDQAMAEMDRQAALMRAQAQRLMTAAPSGDGLMRADAGPLPAGVTGYSFVSTISPRGACTRTVEYRSTGDGRPQVISKTSGDCGAGNAPSGAGAPPARGQPAQRLTSVVYHPAS
jgi:hypothetical protein